MTGSVISSIVACLAATVLVCTCTATVVESSGGVATQQKRQSSDLIYCTPLANHQTHFTVDVSIGTPAQIFSVVADTGSDQLIVPSCVCNEADFCDRGSRCFVDNTSSSFNGSIKGNMSTIVTLTFGSGTVEAAIVSDVAAVGSLSTDMNKSLLLMINQALTINPPFEGILGMGLPNKKHKHFKYKSHTVKAHQSNANTDGATKDGKGIMDSESGDMIKISNEVNNIIRRQGHYGTSAQSAGVYDKNNSIADSIDEVIDEGAHIFGQVHANGHIQIGRDQSDDETRGNAQHGMEHAEQGTQVRHRTLRSVAAQHDLFDIQRHQPKEQPNPIGFLEKAGVGSFTMCFNDHNGNGTLRLGGQPANNSLGSIGTMHWGLDLRGISVGNSSFQLNVCMEKDMVEGQQTPCGAIPDSGTTAIMGPSEGIKLLKESICDHWELCRNNYTAMIDAKAAALQAVKSRLGHDPFGISEVKVEKSEVLELLMHHCSSWLNDGKGVDDLPKLRFYIAGSGGVSETLELSGWSYVLDRMVEVKETVYKEIPRWGKIAVGIRKTGRKERVCDLSVGDLDYRTVNNGPVWILGTPIFYGYHVGYNILSKPPSISFESVKDNPCSPCSSSPSMIEDDAINHTFTRRLRQIDGPMRVPQLDLSQPL